METPTLKSTTPRKVTSSAYDLPGVKIWALKSKMVQEILQKYWKHIPPKSLIHDQIFSKPQKGTTSPPHQYCVKIWSSNSQPFSGYVRNKILDEEYE